MHLRLGHGGGALVLLRQEEADGHEELVDADAELLLVLAAGGQREEAARLDDVLEDVLAGLQEIKHKTTTKWQRENSAKLLMNG